MVVVLLVLEVLEVVKNRSVECESISEVRLVCEALTGSGLSVRLPDLGQLGLFPQLLRVLGAVLDCVSLVASVVADGTDVDIEGGTDHSTTGVLQNMGGVHCLALIVVLAEHTVSRQFLGLLHLLLGLIFESWRNVFKSAG